MTRPATMLLALCFAATASAQETKKDSPPPPLPPQPAPTRAAADEVPAPASLDIRPARIEKGSIISLRTTYVPVTKTGSRVAIVAGKAVTEVFTYTETIPVTVAEKAELKNVTAATVDGTAVSAERLAVLLAEEKPVVVIAAGQKLSAAQKAVLKLEVLVLSVSAPPPPK